MYAIISPPPSIGANSNIWSKKRQLRDVKAWSERFCALHLFITSSATGPPRRVDYIHIMETLTTLTSSKRKLKSLFSLTSLSPAAADIRKCDAFVSVMQNCTNAQMHPPPTNTQHLSFLKAGASASSLNQKKTVKSLLHGIHLGHSYIGLLNSENNLKIGFIFLHKGSSINYVITFGGLGSPPPPYVIL